MLGQRRALGVRIDSQKNINNALVEKQQNAKLTTLKQPVIVKQPVEEKKPVEETVVQKRSYGGKQCMVSEEIVEQIDQYMKMVEKVRQMDSNFLKGAKIDGRMRGILLDWILQIQAKFRLSAETFYLSVFLLDRVIEPLTVTRQNFQLIGLACIVIAAKFEEVMIPNIHDFVYMGGSCCSVEHLFQAERDVLKALKFQLTFTYPNHFLRKFRYSMPSSDQAVVYELSKFLVDICLVDYSSASWLPSESASASIHLAYKILQLQCPEGLTEIVDVATNVAIRKAGLLKIRLPLHVNQTGKLKGLRLKYKDSNALKLVDNYLSSVKDLN